MLAPCTVAAADLGDWDCKVGADGKTWDCQTRSGQVSPKSTTPSTPKPQATTHPAAPSQPVKEASDEWDAPGTGVVVTPIQSNQVEDEKPLSAVRPVPAEDEDEEWSSPKPRESQAHTPSEAVRPRPVRTSDAPVDRVFEGLAVPAIQIGEEQAAPNVVQVDRSKQWTCEANPETGAWECAALPSQVPLMVRAPETPTKAPVSTVSGDTALFTQMIRHLDSNPWMACNLRKEPEAVNFSAIRDMREKTPANISADFAEAPNPQVTGFRGDVAFQRADQFLSADQVTHQRDAAILDAEGDVYYRELGLSAYGSSARIFLDTDQAKMNDVRFILDQSPARGSASLVDIQSADRTRFENVRYSTCEPGHNSWELQADSLTVDDSTGRGEARGVWIEVKEFPVFYTPYITFPIDDRRMTGFLAPTFGNSDDRGTELATPYYWNIAPNYDATFTPRLMSSRGLMLGGQFRYLTPDSHGEFAAEALPNDKEANEDRGQISFQHYSRLSDRLTGEVDLKALSDDEYLEDFGDSLNSASNRHIRSEASLRYAGMGWNLLGRVQNYDTIDDAIASVDRPHRRLPQVLFRLSPMDTGFGGELDMRNEYVYFDHSATTRGSRLDLHPGISWPMLSASGFVTPRVSLRHTQYWLDNEAVGIDPDQSRTLPIVSLDSGLFFDREKAFGSSLSQTLEPRLFYLYVPHDDQDDLPLFDTGEYDFSFSQLFRDNRFSGADRQSDANQITLAVTSRLVDPDTGFEHLRASLGSILYLDKPDVTLNPGDASIDDNTSALVGDLNIPFNDRWLFRSALEYNPHDSITEKASAGLHFRDQNGRIFNLSYRSRQDIADTVEQTDLSYRWPITDSWSSVGRWNYSLEHRVTLEGFFGLEKDTCCWRFRILARRYLNDATDGEPNDSILFQIELKGLSSFGQKLESLLEDGILGYREPD